MVIYTTPDFGTNLGRDIPGMGPFKGFNPNIVGPGAGKLKGAIYIGIQVGRFLIKRPWVRGTLTGTAIGTGTGLIGQKNGRSYKQYKALRAARKQSNKFRRRANRKVGKRGHRSCCCC